ncbi:hypothetical protein CRG98_040091 [Punica granatum]|uniref:Uncharacterized protein n=1 Tax=Punica granatum TaxID=22663 RepID=A0A2I0I6M4_PUNGR|nr:hypothetical protein CRG98_040091 [Punica granatum]
MTRADDDEPEERNLKFSLYPKLGFAELLLNVKIGVGVGVGGGATEEEEEEEEDQIVDDEPSRAPGRDLMWSNLQRTCLEMAKFRDRTEDFKDAVLSCCCVFG